MARQFAFTDVESTHLDPTLADIFEIAVAIDDEPVESWILPHSLKTASPESLEVNRYWERFPGGARADGPNVDLVVRELLADKILVVSNPPFDRDLLTRRWGHQPWFYRSVDISSLAMGVLGHPEPKGLFSIAEELREAYGQDIPGPDHSAAADVEALRACFGGLRWLQGQI